MQHIPIKLIYCEYPIGGSISCIRELTDEYIKAFNTLCYHENTNFNLWCRGSSGAILATAFAMYLPQYKFKICHVKKEGEQSHGNVYPGDKFINIVIDDFVSEGTTVEAILLKMNYFKCIPHILIVSRRGVEKFADKFNFIISTN